MLIRNGICLALFTGAFMFTLCGSVCSGCSLSGEKEDDGGRPSPADSSPRAAGRDQGLSRTPQPDKPVVARGLPATYEENFPQIDVVGALYDQMFTAWHIKIRAQWTDDEKTKFVDAFLTEIQSRQEAGELGRIKEVSIRAETLTDAGVLCSDGFRMHISAPIVKANEMLWRLEGK